MLIMVVGDQLLQKNAWEVASSSMAGISLQNVNLDSVGIPWVLPGKLTEESTFATTEYASRAVQALGQLKSGPCLVCLNLELPEEAGRVPDRIFGMEVIAKADSIAAGCLVVVKDMRPQDPQMLMMTWSPGVVRAVLPALETGELDPFSEAFEDAIGDIRDHLLTTEEILPLGFSGWVFQPDDYALPRQFRTLGQGVMGKFLPRMNALIEQARIPLDRQPRNPFERESASQQLGRQFRRNRREDDKHLASHEQLFFGIRPMTMPPRPILLEGESGTGKELIAQMLHEKVWQGKSIHPEPVAINCAVLKDEDIHSELFGHMEGSFPDAQTHPGLAMSACYGTLFLDEMDRLSLDLQAMLLTYVETNRFRPKGWVGKDIYSPALILAAVHDLQQSVKSGHVNDNLASRFRLRIRIPPLRDRIRGASGKKELGYLVDYILQSEDWNPGRAIRGISSEAFDTLHRHPFGTLNYRELEEALVGAARNARVSGSPSILRHHLKEVLGPATPTVSGDDSQGPVNQKPDEAALVKARAPGTQAGLASRSTEFVCLLEAVTKVAFAARSFGNTPMANRRLLDIAYKKYPLLRDGLSRLAGEFDRALMHDLDRFLSRPFIQYLHVMDDSLPRAKGLADEKLAVKYSDSKEEYNAAYFYWRSLREDILRDPLLGAALLASQDISDWSRRLGFSGPEEFNEHVGPTTKTLLRTPSQIEIKVIERLVADGYIRGTTLETVGIPRHVWSEIAYRLLRDKWATYSGDWVRLTDLGHKLLKEAFDTWKKKEGSGLADRR